MNQHIKFDKGNEPVSVKIGSLSHDGRGIGIINNKTTFISGALPSEEVTCQITRKTNRFYEGESLTVIKSSENRVTPPCQHFGLCGGCSLQHMAIEAQLDHKQQTLLEQLKHFGKVSPATLLPPLSATTQAYRRKARLGVKFVNKKNKVLVGFREKSSHLLADLQHCVVLHPQVGERLIELGHLVASLERYRDIPQIEVAISDHEAALVFRTLQTLGELDEKKLIQFGMDHHFHIYIQPNSPNNIIKLWPKNTTHRLTYTLPDDQLTFSFHPLDFTQINFELNHLMVKQAIQLLELKPNDTVLDLFCGIGNFTLPIARRVKQVIGIEGSAEMVTRAQENANYNNITNVSFYTANLQELTKDSTWSQQQYDKILLDPPRTGAKEIISHFKYFAAEKIVYVSCNPATLARDAGELVHQHGYQLKQVGVMNMFPHTSHIEAIAVFERI